MEARARAIRLSLITLKLDTCERERTSEREREREREKKEERKRERKRKKGRKSFAHSISLVITEETSFRGDELMKVDLDNEYSRVCCVYSAM